MIRILIYNEFLHEKDPACRAHDIYPDGIHAELAALFNAQPDLTADTVTLETVNEITRERLRDTDVLVWWGHVAHGDVPEEIAALVQEEVLSGMGAVFLHSAHKAKPFMRLMGTSCSLIWRESDDLERVWVSAPGHPIAQGLGAYFELPAEETYGEPFGIPAPDETVFVGWFTGGEAFRSGCTWQRGNGKVFYFQPGHETYPTYKNADVRKVLLNAVRWAAPVYRCENCMDCPNPPKAHKTGFGE